MTANKKYCGLKIPPTRISGTHLLQLELFIHPRRGIVCLMIVKFPGLLSAFFNFKEAPTLLLFLSFTWHLFALGPCTLFLSFQMTVRSSRWLRAECFTYKLTQACRGKGMDRGWRSSTTKKTNKISQQESWLFPGHFPPGSRTSLGSQGNTVSAHTQPYPAATSVAISVLMSAQHEEMWVKTGTSLYLPAEQ